MLQFERKQQLVLLLLVGVILFGGGYRFAQMKEPAQNEAAPSLEAEEEIRTPAEFLVHVAGAVENPGVYRLPEGSRVIEAVNLAVPGADADLDALRLASLITDGETIYVPFKLPAEPTVTDSPAVPGAASGAAVPQAAAGTGRNVFAPPAGMAAAAGGLVNLNTAGQSLLETLPGIGPTLAQRVIQYRDINGRFASIEELRNVSGIGDKKYEAVKDLITVR